MKLRLTKFETDALYNTARKYTEKTGKEYSVDYILAMLAEKYAEHLDEDLKEVLERKIEDYKKSEAMKQQKK